MTRRGRLPRALIIAALLSSATLARSEPASDWYYLSSDGLCRTSNPSALLLRLQQARVGYEMRELRAPGSASMVRLSISFMDAELPVTVTYFNGGPGCEEARTAAGRRDGVNLDRYLGTAPQPYRS